MLHDANTADAASRGIWWWIIPPGLMIALTGLAFFLIGNSLDAIANPLRKQNKKI
jgi:peptide/nickel transport system permease protein